jgi:predicted AAA+ superfamily ATPase
MIGTPIRKTKASVLLLGPRQVGKSTLIRSLKPNLEINLTDEGEYYLFQSNPNELRQRIEATSPQSIFIDEIQRVPRITNTIQALIDHNPKLKFYMTGSSARKLKKGHANLLPGRIISFAMAPLALQELGSDWNESHGLSYGFLPGVQNTQKTSEKKLLLRSYAQTYLKEEILAESLVREISGFVRFLNVVAQISGQYLDFSKIAQKAKVARQSIVRHFEILEDTLIARKLENDPDYLNRDLDLVKHPRFFLFDLGVVNALNGGFEASADRIGPLFEHMILNQIENTAKGMALDYNLYNFRTRGGLEVDFILKLESEKWAIECKAGSNVNTTELRSLLTLKKYDPKIKPIVIYRGTKELKDNGVWILPLTKAIDVMF